MFSLIAVSIYLNCYYRHVLSFYREEQEKLNVWVAYLNLENMYGSNDSLQKVLARAIQQNDAKTVYLQMVNIYCKSDKTEVSQSTEV